MAICNPMELKADLKPGQRLLGLDLGSKHIGMALSDTTLLVASPIGTLARAGIKTDAVAIAKLMQERQAGGVVIGLPMNMNGSEGPAAAGARAYAAGLLERSDLFGGTLPIVLWDERLSTVAVTRQMISADMSRKKRAETVDTAAAAYILQGCLDRLRNC